MTDLEGSADCTLETVTEENLDDMVKRGVSPF